MRPGDARAFLEVHHSSVRALAAKDYPPETVEAWAPMPITPEAVASVLENAEDEIRLIAERGGEAVGIGALIAARSHLRACYVAPQAARSGVGTMLLAEIERIARAEGVEALALNSSIMAEAFYRACGYASLGRAEHIMRDGRPMTCVRMTKRISSPPPTGEDRR